jgi:hypothetical protein
VLSAWFLTSGQRASTPATATPALTPVDTRLAAPVEPASSAPAAGSSAAPAAVAEHGVAGEPVAMAHHALEPNPNPAGLPLPPVAGAGAGPEGDPGGALPSDPAADLAADPTTPLGTDPGVNGQGAVAAPAELEAVAPSDLPVTDPAVVYPGVAPPDDPALQGQPAELPVLNPDGSLAVPGDGQPPVGAGAAVADPERGTNGALIFD